MNLEVYTEVGISGNHRIIEWFGLEETLKIIWFQPPCHQQGHLPPDQGAQSSSQGGRGAKRVWEPMVGERSGHCRRRAGVGTGGGRAGPAQRWHWPSICSTGSPTRNTG